VDFCGGHTGEVDGLAFPSIELSRLSERLVEAAANRLDIVSVIRPSPSK
jgi:hypothetical protein